MIDVDPMPLPTDGPEYHADLLAWLRRRGEEAHMKPRPRILDLFCCAGGSAMGYYRAGFDVAGVDIKPQPNYPFPFHQADALTFPLDGYDAIHASPPCQAYTSMNNRHGSTSPALIAGTRAALVATGLPYVIENVSGAKRHLVNPIELTGEMFGLGVHRPRLFESNVMMLAPARPRHQTNAKAVYGKQDGRRLFTRSDGTELRVANLEDASVAMGIDWMSWDEIREAIPPAYTEFIGGQLMQYLVTVRDAGAVCVEAPPSLRSSRD